MQNIGQDAFVRWLAESHHDRDPEGVHYLFYGSGNRDITAWVRLPPEPGRPHEECWLGCRRGGEHFAARVSQDFLERIGIEKLGGRIEQSAPIAPALALYAPPVVLSESAEISVLRSDEGVQVKAEVRLLVPTTIASPIVALQIGTEAIRINAPSLKPDERDYISISAEKQVSGDRLKVGSVVPMFMWIERFDPHFEGTPQRPIRPLRVSTMASTLGEIHSAG